MNAEMKPADTIAWSNSSSSARFIETWLVNLNGWLCSSIHFVMAGSKYFLTCVLFPMKLSSTTEMVPLQFRLYRVSISLMTCAVVFILTLLPSSDVISQKSHPKGQPLVTCKLIDA